MSAADFDRIAEQPDDRERKLEQGWERWPALGSVVAFRAALPLFSALERAAAAGGVSIADAAAAAVEDSLRRGGYLPEGE